MPTSSISIHNKPSFESVWTRWSLRVPSSSGYSWFSLSSSLNLSSLNYWDNYCVTSMTLPFFFFFFPSQKIRGIQFWVKNQYNPFFQHWPVVCLSPGGKYLQWFGQYIESRLIESLSTCQILCYLLSWKTSEHPFLFALIFSLFSPLFFLSTFFFFFFFLLSACLTYRRANQFVSISFYSPLIQYRKCL